MACADVDLTVQLRIPCRKGLPCVLTWRCSQRLVRTELAQATLASSGPPAGPRFWSVGSPSLKTPLSIKECSKHDSFFVWDCPTQYRKFSTSALPTLNANCAPQSLWQSGKIRATILFYAHPWWDAAASVEDLYPVQAFLTQSIALFLPWEITSLQGCAFLEL